MLHQCLVVLFSVAFAAYLALLLVALIVHKLLSWAGLDMGGCPLLLTVKHVLKQLISVKTSLKLLCIFFVNILLASLSASLLALDHK